MADLAKIEAILARIESGESENSACKAEGMARSTFRQMALREKYGDKYARALEGLAKDQVEKMEAVIEEMREKKIDWQIARVEIDARKWFASKLFPRRFGEKLDVTSDGKALPQPILSTVIDHAVSSNDSDKEDPEPQEEN